MKIIIIINKNTIQKEEINFFFFLILKYNTIIFNLYLSHSILNFPTEFYNQKL